MRFCPLWRHLRRSPDDPGFPHLAPSAHEFSQLFGGFLLRRLACFLSHRHHLWGSKSLSGYTGDAPSRCAADSRRSALAWMVLPPQDGTRDVAFDRSFQHRSDRWPVGGAWSSKAHFCLTVSAPGVKPLTHRPANGCWGGGPNGDQPDTNPGCILADADELAGMGFPPLPQKRQASRLAVQRPDTTSATALCRPASLSRRGPCSPEEELAP